MIEMVLFEVKDVLMEPRPDDWTDAWRHEPLETAAADRATLRPEVVATLAELADRFRIGVVDTGGRPLLVQLTDACHAAGLTDDGHALSAYLGDRPTPTAEGLVHLLTGPREGGPKIYVTPPERTVYVASPRVDAEAVQRAGFHAVVVYDPRATSPAAGAAATITTLTELSRTLTTLDA